MPLVTNVRGYPYPIQEVTQGINAWTASATISDGVSVITPGGATVARNGNGTTGAAYDAAEAGSYTLINTGSVLTAYPGAGVYLYAGQTLMTDGALYRWPTDGATTNAAFTASDWVQGTAAGITERFDSIADLNAATLSPSTTLIDVAGYYGVGTLGGGKGFIVDRTDTATAADGISVFLDAAGVRVKRPENGRITDAEAGASPTLSDTDNATRLQAAINYAQTTTKELHLTHDEISHNAATGLRITASVKIVGLGRQKTWRQTNNTAVNIHIDMATGDQAVSLENIELFNGTIGIHHTGNFINRFSRWENLRIAGCTQHGILLEARQIGTSHRKIVCENCDSGISAVGSDLLNAVKFDSCRVASATTNAINIEQTAAAGAGGNNAVSFNNCITEANTGTGVRVFSSGVILNNHWFESNGLDLSVDSNYNGSQVTESNIRLDSVHWGPATQTTRIQFLNHGVQLTAINSTGAVGGNDIIDGGSFGLSSSVTLLNSGLQVINYPAAGVTQLGAREQGAFPSGVVAQANISTLANVEAVNFVGSGFESEFERKIKLNPRVLGPNPASGTLGLNVNAAAGGGGAIAMVTTHTGTGNNTKIGLFLLRFGFDGNNVEATSIAGDATLATFSVDGAGNLSGTLRAGEAQGKVSIISNSGF